MFVFRLDDSRQLPQLRLYYVGGGLHVGQEVEDIYDAAYDHSHVMYRPSIPIMYVQHLRSTTGVLIWPTSPPFYLKPPKQNFTR